MTAIMTADNGNANVQPQPGNFLVIMSHASPDHQSAERDTDHAADETKKITGLHQELLEEIVVRGPDGFAQTDLFLSAR